MGVAPSRATLRASGIMRQCRGSVAAIARGTASHAASGMAVSARAGPVAVGFRCPEMASGRMLRRA